MWEGAHTKSEIHTFCQSKGFLRLQELWKISKNLGLCELLSIQDDFLSILSILSSKQQFL